MELDTLTTFLGWCSVINIGALILTSFSLMLMRGPISTIHSAMFGVSEANLPSTYFQYLANYKIAILILNVVPYFALKIMA